ncbi:hypothetical protein SD71_14170 [Cohnella kolymensis]|uniref:Histidine kinase n=1 Tax=Cohnella kolymensis TaxID=1590652 RepID=A0ABR5A325_9BACL|nr:hypothetical protein [Cohnella kolymensis]KIL35434.1 hypothetical protein SD71_14170 [Cohnella kolymensis]
MVNDAQNEQLMFSLLHELSRDMKEIKDITSRILDKTQRIADRPRYIDLFREPLSNIADLDERERVWKETNKR